MLIWLKMSSHGRSWWKVVIVDGCRWHNRDWLLRRIKDICRYQFREENFHSNGDDLVFFVNNGAVAGALVDTSNRITTRNGTQVLIQVSASSNPWGRRKTNFCRNVILNKDMLEQLKICIGQRFDVSLSKLSLVELFYDPILRNARIDGHIINPSFMKKIYELIQSICPRLKILDLSKNNIEKLDSLAPLAEKCPQLDELILSHNNICFIDELQHINDHKNITKLWLEENPVQNRSSSHNLYLANVKRFLPFAQYIDGRQLPVGLRSETGNKNKYCIPDCKDIYASSRNDLDLVQYFVQNYFQWYDHFDVKRRERLAEFYDDDAAFSLCCNSKLDSSISLNLSHYVQNNRNFKERNLDKHKKVSLLINKKTNIISFLTELPTSNHWQDSYTLDLTIATQNMICFKLQGIFVEGENETPRGFARTFFTQRLNSSLLIVNEQFVVRSLTEKQVLVYEDAKYNNAAAPLAVTINIEDDDNPCASQTTQNENAHQELVSRFAQQLRLINPTVADPNPLNKSIPVEKQEELTLQLTAESKMNMLFSKMCLESSKWNYNSALSKFSKLYRSGGIPSEAFVATR